MEQEIIQWIKSVCNTESANVLLGIGDDAAILNFPDSSVATTDVIAEGTHFDLNTISLQQVGRKAMAVNLSDLAAMGSRPAAALVTLQLPNAFKLEQVQELFSGFQQLANQYHFPIVGGDTNRWEGDLVVGATLIGKPMFANQKGYWRLASGNPGDAIYVTGEFGGSLVERHTTFSPQLEMAAHLLKHHNIASATDASDSLALDLAHLASASGTGFEIDSRRIPISNDAIKHSSSTGLSPLEHALYDGEDFQLIVCVPEDQISAMETDTNLPDRFTRIGQLNDTGVFTMIDEIGISHPLPIKGYQH